MTTPRKDGAGSGNDAKLSSDQAPSTADRRDDHSGRATPGGALATPPTQSGAQAAADEGEEA